MSEIDRKLASVIDHTLLRPEAEGREVERLCVEALRFGFATVCVQPVWVAPASVCAARATHTGCTHTVAKPKRSASTHRRSTSRPSASGRSSE